MSPGAALERAVRETGDRLRAALSAGFRDLDLGEEAFAFACQAAVETWPRDGVPRDPAAWLYAAGRRRGFDLIRRAKVRGAYRPDPPAPALTPEDLVLAALEPIPDERLRLVFACCHPALAPEARIALTLRVIYGLSVERLARAFLIADTAMVQRLTRAKRKIRETRIPFEVPGPDAWGERVEAVLAAVEIAYAQAYEDAALAADGAGFAAEMLRLSGLLAELMPDEPEVLGLAALIRLAEARRPARLGPDGAMTPLSEQDTALWDGRLIGEAAGLMARAAEIGRTGPHQIMATIHAIHAMRGQGHATPWADIVALYDALLTIRPSPPAAVNRAVAVGQAQGPLAGLAALDAAPDRDRLQAWLPWHAARADLLARAGRREEAAEAYDRALGLAPAPAERLYLQRRRAALAPP